MNNLLRMLLFVLVAVLVILGMWWAIGLLPMPPNIRMIILAIIVVVIVIYGIATFRGKGGL